MIPLRYIDEASYQLEQVKRYKSLAALLSSIPVLLTYYGDVLNPEILITWQRLSEEGLAPEEFYPKSLQTVRNPASLLLPRALKAAEWIFYSRGRWALSQQLLEELLVIAKQQRDIAYEMRAEYSLSRAARRLGNPEQSMRHALRALELAEADKNMRGCGAAFAAIANAYMDVANYEEARTYFVRQLEVAQQINDRYIEIAALGNLGTLYWFLGDLEEAERYYVRASELAEDHPDMSLKVIGNIGLIKKQRGDFTGALACYFDQLRTEKLFGDKTSISNTLGNIANLYLAMGKMDDALATIEKRFEIDLRESAGPEIARAKLLKGVILSKRGQTQEAEHFLSSVAVENGGLSKRDLKDAHLALADLYVSRSHSEALFIARTHAQESLRISQELSSHDGLFYAGVHLARIDAASGRTNDAVEALEQLLENELDIILKAEGAYWIWKFSNREEHKRAAIAHYETAIKQIPRFEYRQRLAELRGEPVPLSADEVPA